MATKVGGAGNCWTRTCTAVWNAGKKADLIVIDPHGPSMMPVNDKIAALVTAMHSANIQSTMCDGKWLMRDRKILTLDEEEAILKEACERAKAIYKRAGIDLPDRFRW